MRKRNLLAALSILLAAGPAMAELKVGVANPIKILNELQETKDINKAMESEQAGFKASVEDRQQKLKDLQAKRDELKPDAPQWSELNNQLVKQRTEAQVWGQQSTGELKRKFRDQAKRMNEKITVTVKEVAKAKQVDLVVAEQKPEISDAQMEQMEPNQVMGVLFGKNILYSSDAIDLTQEVIAKLDAAYKAK